ncbi:hypothetical protein [Sphingorhabdus sp.]|jgi:hypothetical protein|uniref:hypothetical protein n=1 Tax=Sphingorhabdus sp. TaxID=1902408 RepID=UPI003BB20A22|nr:DUF4189 domain-containing protein [Sphingomonadales bacterium]MBK9430905.1 DUF4189 domain-containing protein [Sphingomonadales bacterium]
MEGIFVIECRWSADRFLGRYRFFGECNRKLHEENGMIRIFALFFFLSLTFHGSARAEGNCPPGTVPIGGGNSGYEGCAQVSDGPATNNQDLVDELKKKKVKKRFDNHYAVAFHPDSSDVFIMGGATKRQPAEKDARLLCGINMLLKAGADEASVEQCSVTFSSFNNVASFARGMNGDIFYATGVDTSVSDAAVLANCRSQKDYCLVFRHWVAHPTISYAPTQESHQPEGNFRKVYAAAAWQGEASPTKSAKSMIFVTGGHASKAAAENSAVELCQQQTKNACSIARSVADTFMIVAHQSDGRIFVTSSPNEDLVDTITKEVCGVGLTCAVKAVVSASEAESNTLGPF